MLLSSLLLVSCTTNDSYTIKGEEKEPLVKREMGENAYTVNIATNSYHLPDCYIATRITEENKLITYDIDFLCERGYTPCKICINE